MKIIIKKKINSKHTITYIREGFSDYWYEADNFLVLHDLCHYAIEYTLQYKTAFWGLVASGINPNVFENKVKSVFIYSFNKINDSNLLFSSSFVLPKSIKPSPQHLR